MSVCLSDCLSVCMCLSVTGSHFHNSWPILMKLWPQTLSKDLRWLFSLILKILIRSMTYAISDLMTSERVFMLLDCDTLTFSMFMQFYSNWYILFCSSLLCMGLQTSVFGWYLLSKMAAEKTKKPLKPKFAKIEKQNIGWGWFGTADDEYGHI